MWKVRAIRGATTASENTIEAIALVVNELLDKISILNELDPEDIISVTFTVTPDLDAIFPAAIARKRTHWHNKPLLDLQQMQVQGSLTKCIRVLININTVKPEKEIYHLYLNKAEILRPEWSLANAELYKSIITKQDKEKEQEIDF